MAESDLVLDGETAVLQGSPVQVRSEGSISLEGDSLGVRARTVTLAAGDFADHGGVRLIGNFLNRGPLLAVNGAALALSDPKVDTGAANGLRSALRHTKQDGLTVGSSSYRGGVTIEGDLAVPGRVAIGDRYGYDGAVTVRHDGVTIWTDDPGVLDRTGKYRKPLTKDQLDALTGMISRRGRIMVNLQRVASAASPEGAAGLDTGAAAELDLDTTARLRTVLDSSDQLIKAVAEGVTLPKETLYPVSVLSELKRLRTEVVELQQRLAKLEG